MDLPKKVITVLFYETEGKGQFKPVGNANPHLGQLNNIEYVNEVKLNS